MALDQKFFKKSTTAASSGLADQEQGLTVHIDANDVDSYDGDGSIWYDIAGHEVNIPLIDKGPNLVLHLNASNTTSYSGIGNTWADLSIYGNDGAISNTGGTNNPTFESDTRGYFDFEAGDGNDNVEVSDSSSLDITSNITLEAWINEESVFNYGRLIWKNGAYALYRGTNGWNFLTGSDVLVHNSGIPSTGTWYHIAATYDGAHKKLYINGTLVDTESETASIPTNNNSLFIGGDGTGGRYFDGKVSSVRIYNVALTASEVGQNYRAGNFINYSSVITSKHEATQGSLVTAPPVQGSLVTAPPVQSAVHASNLQINLDANSYSGSGNWLDSANNYNALISAATYVNDNVSDYFDFAGSTNNPVSISYNSILNAAARSWEFWVWFDTDAMNFFGGVWGSANNTKTVLFRMKDSNNAIRAQVYDGAGTSVEPTTADNVVNINEWNHIVFTSDNSDNSFKIYVNGVEKHSDTLSIDMNTSSTEDFIIGMGGGYSSNRLDGRVAQFRYYNAALTSAQVNTNYNATKDLYQGIRSLELHLDANGYTSGTWSDTSGNNRHATVNGAAHYNDNNSDYFDFDGSNDYAETSFSQNWASIPFSVEMWFNTDSRNGEYLWGLNENSSMAYGVGASVRGSGNSYHLQFLGSGLIVDAGVVETNRWYHLVFTSDGTTKKAYLDGELKGTGTTTINSGANGQPFIFGRYGTYNGGYFNGKIAQARIYNGAMTAAQVKTNYDATKDLYQGITGLQLHLDANGYSGSGDWQDSANDNDGVINGATYTNDGNSDYFDFDASGSNKITVAGSDLNPANTRTIELWFNADITDTSASRYMISNWSGSGNNYGYHIYVYNNTLMAFVMSQAQNAYFINFQSGGTVTAGKWHHAVLTIGPIASDNNLYLDGELEQTASSTSGTFPTTAAHNGIIIGSYGTTYYDGKIAQVRAYKGNMTAAQVKANYDATKALYQNPTLKLHFDASDIDTTANTWTDKVSSLVLTKSGNSSYDAELGDFLQFEGGYYGNDTAAVQVKDSSGDFTVEYFMQHVFDGSNAVLGIMQNSSNRGVFIGTTPSYILTYNYNLNANSSAGVEITTPTNYLTANRWHHVVFVYDSSANIKFYVDGVLKVTTSVASSSSWTTTDGIRIGDSDTLSYGSNGKLGYLKMYQGKLSDEQVVQNYLATKSQFPNGHNATINGSPTWSTYNQGGVTYNYFLTDASSEYFTIPDSPVFDLINEQSMEVWLYRIGTGHGQYTIDKATNNSSNYGWQFVFSTADKWYFQMHNAPYSGLANLSVSSSVNTWEHIVVTCNGNNEYKLYKNGSLADTQSVSGTVARTTVGLTFGKYSLASNAFNGRFGMIKFYDKTLSGTEVTAAYNNTKGTYGIT